MVMAIKSMEKSAIYIPYSPDKLATRVNMFIWESNYKESKRKTDI